MQLDFWLWWRLPARLVSNIYKYLARADLTMNKMIIIAASVIAALLFIGLLVWFFYPSESSSTSNGSGIMGGEPAVGGKNSGNSSKNK